MERTVNAANQFGPISFYLLYGHILDEIDVVTEETNGALRAMR